MKIPLKTREEIGEELGYKYVKAFLRHAHKKGLVLPERDRLTAYDQKQIYETFFYPDNVEKEWYEKYWYFGMSYCVR